MDPMTPPTAPPKRNMKRILGYLGVGVLGALIGSASAGAAPEAKTKTVEKIVTVDPTVEREQALDIREQALNTRQADLDGRAGELDTRAAAVGVKEAAKKTSTFGDGVYQVGFDIQPGTYATSGGSACYWEKNSGSDGLDGIIGNDNVSGPVVLTIEPAVKFFKSSRCGTWTKR